MPVIRGLSFDFDGSLSLEGERAILEANQEFLDSIKANNDLYAQTHVFIGSNRQSESDDSGNGCRNKNGSCYPHIKAVSDYLEANFDPFLLADLYNNLPAGEAYQKACSLLNESHDYDDDTFHKKEHLNWLHDESKLSILIAQIHKLASEHPDDEIEFYFFDDKKEILDGLSAFFSKEENLKFLPKNLINFYLTPYPKIKSEDGESYISYEPIKGTGEIDPNYRQTVKNIAAASIESETYQAYYPVDEGGKSVKSYAEAEKACFNLTTINFVRDFIPGAKINFPPAQEPTQESEKKSNKAKGFLKSISSSLFNINGSKISKRDNEKGKEKSKSKKIEKKSKKEKKHFEKENVCKKDKPKMKEKKLKKAKDKVKNIKGGSVIVTPTLSQNDNPSGRFFSQIHRSKSERASSIKIGSHVVTPTNPSSPSGKGSGI